MTEPPNCSSPPGRLHALRAGPKMARRVNSASPDSRRTRAASTRSRRRSLAKGARSCPRSARPRPQSATAPGTHGWRRHAEDVLEAARQSLASLPSISSAIPWARFVSMQAAALEAGPDPAPGPDRRRRRSRTGRALPIVAAVQRLDVVYPTEDDYLSLLQRLRARRSPGRSLLGGAHYRSDLEPVASGVRPGHQGRGGRGHRLRLAAGREELLAVPDHAHAPGPRGAPAPARHRVRGRRQVARRLPRAVPSAEGVEIDANHYGVMAPRLAARHRRLPHSLTNLVAHLNPCAIDILTL